MPPFDLGFDAAPALAAMREFVAMGGPAMMAIAVLSVAALSLILWKIWALFWMGAFSGGRRVRRALMLWQAGDRDAAQAVLAGRRSVRARLVRRAMEVVADPAMSDDDARAETARVARALLGRARAGLRGLELAATIGPLLGLFGTVTGMIAAFQALQIAGSKADPATLAGGIWEALLTTAAGMAVAIPAQIALTWFEAINDRLRHDLEDAATQVFVGARPVGPAQTLAAAQVKTKADATRNHLYAAAE